MRESRNKNKVGKIKLGKKIENENEIFGADWLRRNIYDPTPTIEKKINDYITLKMVHGRTYIYVKGKRFIQCIRLILNISKEDVHLYDEIDSIDEAAQLYKNHVFQNRIVQGPLARPVPNQEHTITPEQEFWGHCSNIQAWVEHDYDTRILMNNISFPLLRELVKAGDPKASRIFKEEIALRLESGHPTVVQYLLNQGYLNNFSPSEFKSILDTTELIKGLSSDSRTLSRFLKFCSSKFPSLFEDILLQIIKLPEGKEIIISSISISGGFRMLIRRGYLGLNPQYIKTLKNALENLSRNADEPLRKKFSECLQPIERMSEGIEPYSTNPLIERERRYEAMKKFNLALNKMELLGNEDFFKEFQIRQSRCAYCGKIIPKGQDVCDWCGHKKRDDEDGFLPYPYIFKPPGGGGAMKGSIAVPVKIKSSH